MNGQCWFCNEWGHPEFMCPRKNATRRTAGAVDQYEQECVLGQGEEYQRSANGLGLLTSERRVLCPVYKDDACEGDLMELVSSSGYAEMSTKERINRERAVRKKERRRRNVEAKGNKSYWCNEEEWGNR